MKVWITGAGGFLGSQVVKHFVKSKYNFELFSLVPRKSLSSSLELPNQIVIDLNNFSIVKKLFHETKPEVIVHLAAKADANWCEENQDLSFSANFKIPINIAMLCAETNTHLIFASTDLVFNGTNPPYSESDKPEPLSKYATHKLMAEEELLKIIPKNVTICRIPLLFGAPSYYGRDPNKTLHEAVKGTNQVKLFTDEFRTPASTRAIAEGLILLLEERPTIIHLGGLERVSRYEYGRRLIRWLGKSEECLIPCLVKDIKMPAPRPKDVSLKSDLAFSLGFKPLTLEEEWAIEPFFQQLKMST